jgi:hypothetical protein
VGLSGPGALTGSRCKIGVVPTEGMSAPADGSRIDDHVGPAATEQSSEPEGRQCGRCRKFVTFDPATASTEAPAPTWWACPPCHVALFGN